VSDEKQQQCERDTTTKKYKQNFKVSTEGRSFVIGKLVAKWAFA
jgi:hypothetical protein